MRKKLILSVLTVIMLASFLISGCGGAPTFQEMLTKGKAVKELSYTMVMTEDGTEAIKAKVYMKNDNVRMEMSDPTMGELVIINNATKKESYFYNPTEKQAIKSALDESSSADIPNPENLMKDADVSSAKYVSEETVDGKKAYVYDYKDTEGTTKIWMWADNGVPLKFEGTVDGKKTVVEFKDVKVGGIDDSMFELPADATVF